MVKGDEDKPMSLLEYISDAPRDAEPYLVYLINFYTEHRKYWEGVPEVLGPDRPSTRDCVLAKIDYFLLDLENIQRKLQREKAERLNAQIS